MQKIVKHLINGENWLLSNIGLKFTFKGHKPHEVTTEEVRIKIREISEGFYGEVATTSQLDSLNNVLENSINIPYDLKIKAEIIGNNVKLFGYTPDSKAVLDPNSGIPYIKTQKMNNQRTQK